MVAVLETDNRKDSPGTHGLCSVHAWREGCHAKATRSCQIPRARCCGHVIVTGVIVSEQEKKWVWRPVNSRIPTKKEAGYDARR